MQTSRIRFSQPAEQWSSAPLLVKHKIKKTIADNYFLRYLSFNTSTLYPAPWSDQTYFHAGEIRMQ